MRHVALVAGRLVLALSIAFLAWLLPAPPELGATPLVSGLRFGHDGTRTRIVIELDERIGFAATVAAAPPRLIIDLPEVQWRPRNDPLAQPRGLAEGYRYQPSTEGGARLVIAAREPFRIMDQFVLPPSDGNRAFRLVVDLVPGAPEPAPLADPAAANAAGRQGSTPALLAALRPRPKPALGQMGTDPVLAKPPLVVIDPGHGGTDPGTIGVNGEYEKDVVLTMARELRDVLLATGRYRVMLTRDADVYIPLRERSRMAREWGADLFISLHADSLADGAVRGASVYTLSETASDEEAARLAAKENRVDVTAGHSLSHEDPMVAGILLDLAFRDANNRSIAFAEHLVAELADVTHLIRRHRRYAGFVVLKSPEVPSVLVELGYLSNPKDAAMLADASHRGRLAGAIQRAIERHFDGD